MIHKTAPRFLASSLAPLLLLLAGVSMLAGCNTLRPAMLRARYIQAVPAPNGTMESAVWGAAPSLIVMVHRGTGRTYEKRPVELRAIHDGRAISIMARWADDRETFVRRAWVWNEARERYDLETYPIDQFAIMWPLSKRASFDMLDGKAASYDVWQWRAGWSDLSGYADDRRLILKPHPKGEPPKGVKGPLYPTRHGMIEFDWREDSGTPGTQETERPLMKIKTRMPGGVMAEAKGSATDVQAHGQYYSKIRRGGKDEKTWSIHPKGDYWYVEFYRLLVSGSTEEDYQIRSRGPHRFAIAIWDNESGGDHFISNPLRLVLDKTPQNPS